MSTFAQFTKWLRKKQIQIEVTFAVYMFTPWEKFAFCTSFSRLEREGSTLFITPLLTLKPTPPPLTDSIVFLLFSLTFIAAVLYLPHHITVLAGRVWYYINGDSIDVAASARGAIREVLTSGVLDATIPIVTAGAVGTPPVKVEL
ncbi:hypothetical protein G3M48_001195 [Beauveria asiatica]|uniref:Uncharacterized protein n=1 Tax=Beauveria asiatica TaxID=1069075 RepID=A0AAW0RZH1_9HYPO